MLLYLMLDEFISNNTNNTWIKFNQNKMLAFAVLGWLNSFPVYFVERILLNVIFGLLVFLFTSIISFYLFCNQFAFNFIWLNTDSKLFWSRYLSSFSWHFSFLRKVMKRFLKNYVSSVNCNYRPKRLMHLFCFVLHRKKVIGLWYKNEEMKEYVTSIRQNKMISTVVEFLILSVK